MNLDLAAEFEFEVVTVNRRGEITHRETHRAQQFVETLSNGVTLEMVAIPAGMFLMGSRPGQGYEDEHPQHNVRISSFWLGKYPVTQEQWQAVMGKLPPCRCRGAKLPVDRVTWPDARKFCERLSVQTGRAYRLPSEAEWEYGCRARTNTPFYFGETITTDLANYVGEHTYLDESKGVYRHVATVGGTFPPNKFGLYDMHGNMWEWCADAWHDTYTGAPADGSAWQSHNVTARVLRGGCWHDPPGLCRSTARLRQEATDGEDFFGFRVAVTSLEMVVNTEAGLSPVKRMAHRIRRWFAF